MITTTEVEDTKHTIEGFALVCRKLGYKSEFGQLDFGNGTTASDVFEFFEDNPGAIEALLNWVVEHKTSFDQLVGNEGYDNEDLIDMVVSEGKLAAIKYYRNTHKNVMLKDAADYIDNLVKTNVARGKIKQDPVNHIGYIYNE